MGKDRKDDSEAMKANIAVKTKLMLKCSQTRESSKFVISFELSCTQLGPSPPQVENATG